MVRCMAVALILAHILLLISTVHATVNGGSSGEELSAIVRVDKKNEGQRNVEAKAEQPSANDDQAHLITEGEEDDAFEAEAPTSRRMGKHKGTDPSIAGGGVILGGLAMAIFAAVFSYIRVTKTKGNVNNAKDGNINHT